MYYVESTQQMLLISVIQHNECVVNSDSDIMESLFLTLCIGS